MQAEEPFLAADRPWTRASLIVRGASPEATGPGTMVAPGPLDA